MQTPPTGQRSDVARAVVYDLYGDVRCAVVERRDVSVLREQQEQCVSSQRPSLGQGCIVQKGPGTL